MNSNIEKNGISSCNGIRFANMRGGKYEKKLLSSVTIKCICHRLSLILIVRPQLPISATSSLKYFDFCSPCRSKRSPGARAGSLKLKCLWHCKSFKYGNIFFSLLKCDKYIWPIRLIRKLIPPLKNVYYVLNISSSRSGISFW